mmetsp:Transcript_42322/g.101937  ORF Transcript_42322/g.101937 Transcript_42322/m.101937 type:complete len:675 (-) Transcript_42322:1417-3441(-)
MNSEREQLSVETGAGAGSGSRSGAGAQVTSSQPQPTSAAPNPNNVVQVGNAGSFLRKACEEGMPDERLFGSIPVPPAIPTDQQTSYDNNNNNNNNDQATPYQNLVTLSKFLASYRAQKVLVENSSNLRRNRDQESYLSAVADFTQAQIDRQSVGLQTNTDKESAQGSASVVSSHKNALTVVLLHAENAQMHHPTFEFPKKEFLFSWHALMCPTNRQSGMFRTDEARLGNVVFCPSKDLSNEITSFGEAMEIFYNRWADRILMGMAPNCPSPMSHAKGGADERLVQSTYYGVALAAVMLYGVTDIHPFADGNGRMARICTNWILRRVLGLPFSVTLTATPQQRTDFVSSLKSGRHWISKVERKEAKPPSDTEFVPGIFQRIIFMLLHRIAHAVHGCDQLVADKTRAATAIEEARIARVVRDRAAAQQCVICLEDHPNILTICCGHATHLNCLAEWLATATNCVACRKPLPGLQLTNGSSDQADETDDDNEDGVPINASANPRNDVWNAVLTNMLWEAAETSVHDDICGQPNCRNSANADCDNGMCRRCCILHGEFDCEIHDCDAEEGEAGEDDEMNQLNSTNSNDDSITDLHGNVIRERSLHHALMGATNAVPSSFTLNAESSQTHPPDLQQQQEDLPFCRRCSSRAAVDCENQMCGRHCVLHGWRSCTRHNTQR